MDRDLTQSNIERQNILNNQFAVENIAKSLDVVVNAYGIQTTNLNDGKAGLDGDNSDGKVAPMDVWEILKNQRPSLDVSTNEHVHTDVKQ